MTTVNTNKSDTQNAAHLLTILSWLIFFILGTIGISVLAVDLLSHEVERPGSFFWPAIYACVGYGSILLITANSLKHHRQWARYATAFLAFISLIAFPVGTAMGLIILSYLHKGWNEL